MKLNELMVSVYTFESGVRIPKFDLDAKGYPKKDKNGNDIIEHYYEPKKSTHIGNNTNLHNYLPPLFKRKRFIDFVNKDNLNRQKEQKGIVKPFNIKYSEKAENINYSDWDQVLFIDIDSKKIQGWGKGIWLDDLGNEIDKERVKHLINVALSSLMDTTYLGYQISSSGNSFHLFFHIDPMYWGGITKDVYTAICTGLYNYLKNYIFTKDVGSKDGTFTFEKFSYKEVLDKSTLVPTQPCYDSGNDLVLTLNPECVCGEPINMSGNKQLKECIDKALLEIHNQKECKENRKETYVLSSKLKINSNKNSNISWDHTNRYFLICALYEVLNQNYNDAYSFYSSCYDLFIEHYNIQNRDITTEMLDKDFNHIWNMCNDNTFGTDEMKEFILNNTNVKEIVEDKYIYKKLDDFKYDKVYHLNENEYLSKYITEIIENEHTAIHLTAGCGLGKTYAVKSYIENNTNNSDLLLESTINSVQKLNKKILFIVSKTAILDDNFENNKNFKILHGESKFNPSAPEYKDVSICTTWESAKIWKLLEKDWDAIFIDESHTLYLYDYRIKSIFDIKSAIKNAIKRGQKVIFMSGTPGQEKEEFNTYNIKIEKKVHSPKCKLLYYNESFRGWLYKEVKNWISENENNVALVFYDFTNDNEAEKWIRRGIIPVLVYYKSNKDDVEYVKTNKHWKNGTNLISTLGQEGINTKGIENQRVRIYIANKNAMSIIQYINRIRNKECIDCIYIPYKKADISNKTKTINEIKDEIYEKNKLNVESRINTYNLMRYQFGDISNCSGSIDIDNIDEVIKNKNIFENKYHFKLDYCNKNADNSITFNESLYETYAMIEISQTYETQIGVIYNRLIEAQFDVEEIYLDEDVEDDVKKRKSGSNFYGAMQRFNVGKDVVITRNNDIFLNPDSIIRKYASGDVVNNINDILKYMHKNNWDIQETFNKINNKLIEKYNTIAQKNIKNLALLFELNEDLPSMRNVRYLKLLADETYDLKKIVAEYVYISFKHIKEDKTNKIAASDWREYTDDTYEKLKKYREVLLEYPEFIDLNKYEDDVVYNTQYEIEEGQKFYIQIMKRLNSKKANNKKQIKVTFDDGRTEIFNSQDECAKTLNINSKTIKRVLSKNGYIKKLKCKIEQL